eukprot:6399690-Karenia_brevis.AAC.1
MVMMMLIMVISKWEPLSFCKVLSSVSRSSNHGCDDDDDDNDHDDDDDDDADDQKTTLVCPLM